MNYSSLLRTLDAPSQIVAACEDQISLPRFTLMAGPGGGFGFPPIAIPIWHCGDWPGYIGMVVPWFGGDEYGFVRYDSETGRMQEIARTPYQLFTALAFDFLCNVPNHEEVGLFAEAAGLCVASQVESHFRNVQEYHDLLELDVFQQDPPNALTGKNSGAPSWLLARVTVGEVAEAVRSKEYNLAWRRLNSVMPEYSETIELLDKLGPHAENPEFGNLVQCWRQYNWSS